MFLIAIVVKCVLPLISTSKCKWVKLEIKVKDTSLRSVSSGRWPEKKAKQLNAEDNIYERGNTVVKSKNEKTIAMKITMFIVTMMLITLGYQGIRLRQVSQQLAEQLKNTQKEITIESTKLEDLQKEYNEIDSLQNIEKVARDKLGYVKNDEIVFKIP